MPELWRIGEGVDRIEVGDSGTLSEVSTVRQYSNIGADLLLNLQALVVGVGALCIAGTSFCVRYLRRFRRNLDSGSETPVSDTLVDTSNYDGTFDGEGD